MHIQKRAGRCFNVILLGFFFAAPSQLWAAPTSSASGNPGDSVAVSWTATQPNTVIKVFGPSEIRELKKRRMTETDPNTGKKSRFEGVLLSDVIDQALKGMTNDRKALIDLIVLRNAQGAEALIPRSFIVKYPVLLASSENQKSLGGLESVVPWTSHPKTRSEGLPLQTYFVHGVSDVQLGNYHQRYGDVFLKDRTDPLAMRGEKIFVQSCLSCHDSGSGMTKAREWMGTHPSVNGSPKLDSREQRALQDYLQSFKSERASSTASR